MKKSGVYKITFMGDKRVDILYIDRFDGVDEKRRKKL